MPNWYKKYIVPRLLISGMASEDFQKMRSNALIDASGIVLEIGVGPGYNIPLYKNISKLYALEPSQELIHVAQTRTSLESFPIEFLHTGAENIPLPDNSVDTVVSTWTLCSVTDIDMVVKEIFRVLRPNGIFIFVDHGISPEPLIRITQKIITPISKHFTGNCHLDRDIEGSIKKAGFTIQKMSYSYQRYKPLSYNYQGIAKKIIS